MANNCFFEIKIVGKKENVETLMDYLQARYDYEKNKFSAPYHIGGRIFECDFNDFLLEADDLYSVIGYGDCAWSVYSCFMSGDLTYNASINKTHKENSHSLSIEEASKMLNVDVEIYSTEDGFGFAEHYLIKDGNVEIEEEVDYSEYYWVDDYNSPEEAADDLDLDLKNCVVDGETIIQGGFGDYQWLI